MFPVRVRATFGAVATVLSIAAAATVVSSCGDDGPDTPSVPGEPGVVPITGGERLGWNQAAPSLEAIRSHSFRLFVDGTETPMSDTRCGDATGAEGYECSGRLPSMQRGRHTLELAAVWNGQPSPRSAPLTVMAMSPSQTMAPTAASRAAADAGALHVVAHGLQHVSWLSIVPDGRLLFVENDRAVRVVNDAALLPEPAYVVDSTQETIAGFTVDPAFERTRHVFMAIRRLEADGSRTLSIVRYREIGNTLGQGAAIVTGLPLSADFDAPLGADKDGLVYVAYDGFVLRVASDGSVPRANPRASPIVAAGFATPRALAVDDAHRRVWIAGTHPSWSHSVATFSMDAAQDAAWPQQPHAGLPRGADRQGRPASNLSIRGSVLTLVTAGIALRAPLAPDGAAGSMDTIRFGAPGAVTAIVERLDGGFYAAVDDITAGAASIVLVPRP